MNILSVIAGLLYSNDKLVSVVGETAENGGIESGGNAGAGYYTKYPDGTLILFNRFIGNTNASGFMTINFAVPFVGDYSAHAQCGDTDFYNVYTPGWVLHDPSSVLMLPVGTTSGQIMPNTELSVSLQVIGRWK